MSSGVQHDGSAIGVECIVPLLRATSLPASLRYYVQIPGFKVAWGAEAGSGAQGQPVIWLWIGVEDIDPLFAAYRDRGPGPAAPEPSALGP
jgi:hypothetical protein